jgi:predicted MarR family transcription regulator
MNRPPPTLAAAAASPTTPAAPGHRIVTSQHLVSPKSPELSEVEFGLAIVFHAYSRWMVRCMAAAGFADTAALDVLVLHHVNSQDQEKKLADICFVLNVEDTHVVSYALKKLVGMGLVEGSRRGKEVYFRTNERGRQACERYRQVRETCLMPGFAGTDEENARLGDTASLLRTLSGRYDQAARAAAASAFTSLGAGPPPALVPPPARRRSAPEAS